MNKKQLQSCISIFTILIIALLGTTYLTFAQNSRPDIQWMRGGHTLDVTSMDYSPDGQLFGSNRRQ